MESYQQAKRTRSGKGASAMLNRNMRTGRHVKEATWFFIVVAICALFAASAVPAAELDSFDIPPQGDPSEYTGPFIGLEFADNALRTLPDANEGSLLLQGGVQGTVADIGVNNSVPAPGQSNG